MGSKSLVGSIVLLVGTNTVALPTHADPQLPACGSGGVQAAQARQLGTLLEIERAEGSWSCPDTDAVFRAIAKLFPERALRRSTDPSDVVASARVQIRPVSVGHEALVAVTHPKRGERVILDRDFDCRGLADALAVALVLLVEPPEAPRNPDASRELAPPSEVPSAELPTATAPKPKSALEPEVATERALSKGSPTIPKASSPRKKSLGAEARTAVVGGVGVLSKPALGAGVGLDLFHQSGWGLTLHGLRLWSSPAESQGGSVTLTLWAAALGPCYRYRIGSNFSLDTCVRFAVGVQHSAVDGFVEPASGNHPFMTVGPVLRVQQNFGRVLGGFVSLGGFGQLRPQSFSVKSGDATPQTIEIAAAPRVGLMAELGLLVQSGAF